jgi:phospholipase C
MQWDANDPMMSGFIRDYATVSPNDPFGVGQYYGAANLPAMDFFAKHFCVCDQWFSCIPASTQPNRLIAMSGYALRDHTLQQFLDDQENIIYDWLDLHGVSWRVYSEDVPFFTLMPKVRKRILSDIWGYHFRGTVALQHDFNANDTFPQVVFIEPAYSDGPRPERGDDDHPTTPVTRGQEFLLRIYNTLIQNKARWGKSVLIITYDEHGGFFDHIQPPPLITRQGHGERYDHFTTLGVRVPALIISPFVDEGRPFRNTRPHVHSQIVCGEVWQTWGAVFRGCCGAYASPECKRRSHKRSSGQRSFSTASGHTSTFRGSGTGLTRRDAFAESASVQKRS